MKLGYAPKTCFNQYEGRRHWLFTGGGEIELTPEAGALLLLKEIFTRLYSMALHG